VYTMKLISIASLIASSTAAEVQIASGSFMAIDHNSKTINFGKRRDEQNKKRPTFDAQPAVFAGLLTFNGTHPGIAAVKGVSRREAKFHVDEPSCYSRANQGGIAPHPMKEQLDWMAISKGQHLTDEGRPFIVGEKVAEPRGQRNQDKRIVTHSADEPDLWTKVDFPANMFTDSSKDIIVLAQAISKDDPNQHDNSSGDRHWHNIRLRNVNRDSFEFHIENDQYAGKDHEHDKLMGKITVNYMAIEDCRVEAGCHIQNREYNAFRADKIYSKISHEKQVVAAKNTAPLLRYDPLTGSPLVFASISHNGADTAVMRIKHKKRGNLNEIVALLVEPTGINEGEKCGWDNTHPMKEDVYMFLMADSYRCDERFCKDWGCHGPGGWCECFDESKTKIYDDYGCVGDDDEECDCGNA